MKKVYIWWVCGECNEPIGIIDPCKELGYNAFSYTNFHGELSLLETKKLRQDLILALTEEGFIDKANDIRNNTKVIEVEFKL